MAARTCNKCQINWPPSFLKATYMMGGPKYRCPVCSELTALLSTVTPISHNHAEFEVHYAEREKKRLAEDIESFGCAA